jgi:hypothetical protein
MPKMITKTSLDLRRPILVTKGGRFSGRFFKPGDALPWRRLSIPVTKLVQLYEQNKLHNAPVSVEELEREADEEIDQQRRRLYLETQNYDQLRDIGSLMGIPYQRAKSGYLSAIMNSVWEPPEDWMVEEEDETSEDETSEDETSEEEIEETEE